jgi:small-conductance mechanosensitive channel
MRTTTRRGGGGGEHGRAGRVAGLLAGLAALAIIPAAGAAAPGEGDEPATAGQGPSFQGEPLNPGLPPLEEPPDRETPQASLANFVLSCESGDFARAAWSMDLGSLPAEDQARRAPEFARMLKAVMDQKVWIDWGGISDRPDGQLGTDGQEETPAGRDGPRRAIKLGSAQLDPIDAEFWLVRVRPGDAPPVWVLSRQTVAHAPALYRRYGPRPFERRLPGWLRARTLGGVANWQWLGIAALLLLGVAVGWGVQEAAARVLDRSRRDWARALAGAVRGPVAWTVGLGTFEVLAGDSLRLAGPVMLVVEPVVLALIVLGLTWLLTRTLNYTSERISLRYDGQDGGYGPTVVTRVAVARHFLTAAVWVLGIGLALTRFAWFREMGTTLLASAGIAAAVLGLVAQRPLGNLLAGIQMALTQPVRLGDAVIFQDEFGWIERIEMTYVAIRTWDLRRVVVPTAYFIDNPIQNWSMGGAHKIKPVYLHADYRVDVAAVRAELERLVKDHPDYDQLVPPILQVTDCGPSTVVLRALCSARDAASSWNLHCQVREGLVGFLQRHEGGRYLPRTRVAVVDQGPSPDPRDADRSADRTGRTLRQTAREGTPIGGADSEGDGQGDGPGHGDPGVHR